MSTTALSTTPNAASKDHCDCATCARTKCATPDLQTALQSALQSQAKRGRDEPTLVRRRPRGTYMSWDWVYYVNPEGEPYYRAESRRLIVAEDVINDRNIRTQIEDEADAILEVLKCDINDWEWYLEYHGEDSNMTGYFVDHLWQTTSSMRDDEDDGDSIILVRNSAKSSYWFHVCRFPMHLKSSPTRETMFLTAMTHGAAERVTNERETVFPYTSFECQRLIEVYWDLKRAIGHASHIKENDGNVQQLRGSLNWHIANAMEEISHQRHAYKYGTWEVRTHRDLPDRFKAPKNFRFIDAALSFFFFGMQSTYRRRIEGTRYKGVIHMPDFHKLFAGLMREWTDSNLLATVLVSANVAFLAVPDISNLQKTASLASTLFGMVSILAGVHHNWRHRSQLGADVESHARVDADFKLANHYLVHLEKRVGHSLSVTLQACFLSLPVVLLLWAVVTFIVAISAYSVQKTALSTRLVLSCLIGVLVITALCTLLYFSHIWYEKEPYLDDPDEDEADSKKADDNRSGPNAVSKIPIIPQVNVATATEMVGAVSRQVVDSLLRFRRPAAPKVGEPGNGPEAIPMQNMGA